MLFEIRRYLLHWKPLGIWDTTLVIKAIISVKSVTFHSLKRCHGGALLVFRMMHFIEANVNVNLVTKIPSTAIPDIDKHVTCTLQTTDTGRYAEAVPTRNNAYQLNADRDLYPDGPGGNAPENTSHTMEIRNPLDVKSSNTVHIPSS